MSTFCPIDLVKRLAYGLRNLPMVKALAQELADMKYEPTVSIIINNYNYDRFPSEAIDSALNQTYPFIEVLF